MLHSDTVLVVGPLPPLAPRAFRLRLRAAVIALLAAVLGPAVLGAAVLALESEGLRTSELVAVSRVLPNGVPDATSRAGTIPILVVSSPAGATILRGDRELGHTPAQLFVAPEAVLTLRVDGFLDDFVRANAAMVDALLWRARPDVRVVRSPLPGAVIRSVNFLPDGRVSLDVEVPPSGERQAWAYDPVGARLQRLGSAATPGTLPSEVAIAPDGTRTAAILRLDGLDGAAADQLTLDGPDGSRQPLSAVAVGERLLDASWSPNTAGVLVWSQRRVVGGSQLHLRWVRTDGSVRDLADLSGEPVVGSSVWAPDGHAAAFLVHTSVTALVTLDLATGELRYLDDVRGDALLSSGAVAPATWERSGGLLYAAPAGAGGYPETSVDSAPVLFEVGPGRIDGRRVGDVEPVWAPIVRPDGVLLTLARADNDVLVLRPVDPAGHALAAQPLGVTVSGAYAAHWDLSHQQLLIVRGANGGGVEVLLLRFGVEDAPAGVSSNSGTAEAGR